MTQKKGKTATGKTAPGKTANKEAVAAKAGKGGAVQSCDNRKSTETQLLKDFVVPIVFPNMLIDLDMNVDGNVDKYIEMTGGVMVRKNNRLYAQGIGHAGVLIIDGSTKKYMYAEYGRYEYPAYNGLVMSDSEKAIVFSGNTPDKTVLDNILKRLTVSKGKNSKIFASAILELPDGSYEAMKEFVITRKNLCRTRAFSDYSIYRNNCMTFVLEVMQAGGDSAPEFYLPIHVPTATIKAIQLRSGLSGIF